MKKKNILKKLLCLMAVVALLTPSVAAFAMTCTDVYLAGNRYTVVAYGNLPDASGYVLVEIHDIRTDNNKNSLYRKVRGDVLDEWGHQLSASSDVSLVKGDITAIPLAYRYPEGTAVKLRMKGNTSFLDCFVDFTVELD